MTRPQARSPSSSSDQLARVVAALVFVVVIEKMNRPAGSRTMHTVRLISQACDRESRAILLDFMGRPGHDREYTRRADAPNAIGVTIFDFDHADGTSSAVRVVDYDHPVTFKLTANDVVYADASAYWDDGKADNIAKLKWLEQFASSDAQLWTYDAREQNPLPRGVARTGYGVARPWRRFIHSRFRIPINAVQTTRCFRAKQADAPKPVVPPSILDPVARLERAQQVPWALPSMTIMLPTYVVVTGATHDPSTGALTIKFE